MDVLILTGKFGMGHLSASRSLQLRLERHVPSANVAVEDFFSFAIPDVSHVMYKGFEFLVTVGSVFFNSYYKRTEHNPIKNKIPFDNHLLDKLEELIALRNPRVIVATHPNCGRLTCMLKRERGLTLPLVTCVTDLTSHGEWIHEGTVCYLVGTPDIRDGLIEKGVSADQILVSGIPVKPEFAAPQRQVEGGERRLLIMGGGLGLMPKGERFYEELSALPQLKTTIITGSNRRLYQRLAGKYPNIEVVGYTDRVHEYMAQAHLLLSKPGGITLFEAITSQLPMLALEPFLHQEVNNADFVLEQEIGRWVSKEPTKCLQAIRDLIYDEVTLSQMSANMGRIKDEIDTDSATRLLATLAGKGEPTQ